MIGTASVVTTALASGSPCHSSAAAALSSRRGAGGRRGAAEDGDTASVRVGAELQHWCRRAAEELPGCTVAL